MIVYRQWRRGNKRLELTYFYYEGWFLLGVIPLYIRRQGYKP